MGRRRKTAFPAGTRGLLVLDSGAVTKVAFGDAVATSIVDGLSSRGWTVCIPAVTLAEVITGSARTDAAVERLVKRVSNTVDCDERLAKQAGVLRARSGRSSKPLPSAVDAIVAAVTAAGQPSAVLTTDPDDLADLLGSAPRAAVLPV